MTLDAGLNKTTSTDHRGWLWVTTILSIVYTISVLIARLFGKYGLLWYDDATMGLAYVRNSVSSSNTVRLMKERIFRWDIQMRAISDGLGADLAIANLLPNSQNIALLSIVVFSHRIFSGNLNHEAAIFATVYGIIGVSGIASMHQLAATHPITWLVKTVSLAYAAGACKRATYSAQTRADDGC
ncbi:hypothetical protein LTR49_023825 [Elasticomyces elasticus]|nr:hypothetical protein LTR49_023825 [Elasticomyces elasticus]